MQMFFQSWSVTCKKCVQKESVTNAKEKDWTIKWKKFLIWHRNKKVGFHSKWFPFLESLQTVYRPLRRIFLHCLVRIMQKTNNKSRLQRLWHCAATKHELRMYWTLHFWNPDYLNPNGEWNAAYHNSEMYSQRHSILVLARTTYIDSHENDVYGEWWMWMSDVRFCFLRCVPRGPCGGPPF